MKLTIKENFDSDKPLIKARFTSLHQFGLVRMVCIVVESGWFFPQDPRRILSNMKMKAMQYEPTKALQTSGFDNDQSYSEKSRKQ